MELRKPVSGHYLVDAVQEGAKRIWERHGKEVKIIIRWIPGHEGVRGNEECDTEAKKAAEGSSSAARRLPIEIRGKLPISKAAAKQSFKDQTKERNKSSFKKSPRCHKIRRIDKSCPSKAFRIATEKLPRRHASILIQLRTGHAPLNAHLHRTKCAPSPKCPKCHNKDETVHHFLIECPGYDTYRRELEATIRQGARSLSNLLSNNKAFRPLFKYIHKTRRFEGTFGNLNLPPASHN